jgi:hypothetical protein
MQPSNLLFQAFYQDAWQCVGVLPFAKDETQVKAVVDFLNCFKTEDDVMKPSAERIYLNSAMVSGYCAQALEYINNVWAQRSEDEKLLLLCQRLYAQWMLNDPDRLQTIQSLEEQIAFLQPCELHKIVAGFVEMMQFSKLEYKPD